MISVSIKDLKRIVREEIADLFSEEVELEETSLHPADEKTCRKAGFKKFCDFLSAVDRINRAEKGQLNKKR